MPYETKDLYSTRHDALVNIFKDTGFSTSDAWKPAIDNARLMVVADGFDVGKYAASEGIRKAVATGKKAKAKPAETMMAGAGLTGTPAGDSDWVSGDLVNRIAGLEMLRHLWLLKKSGSHKLWILSLPNGYIDWPDQDLSGKTFGGIATRLNDETSHFSTSDRKHLSEATQEGLKWVHKAMLVAASPTTKKNKEILRRWFADADTTDEQLNAAAEILNTGLKKISTVIKSTFLLFVDMPMDRTAAANTNAYVFSDEKISVVYIEAAFFGKEDTWKDLKNWTRIVVHELTHREAKTKDHRYRHHAKGLKPDAGDATFNAAKALENADSWAIFCMDCAGRMTKGDYTKVKV